MAITRFSKWIPSPLDGLSMEELLDQISEFLLQSGFRYGFQDAANPNDLDALRQAIIEKLMQMGRIPETLSEDDAQKLDEMIDQVIRQLMEEGWIQTDQQQQAPSALDENGEGVEEAPSGSARFELT